MRASDASPKVEVLSEIVIARTLPEVAEYAADPSNAPEWYENIEVVEWETPPPVAVGTQVGFVARFLGRRLAYTYEVVEYLPLERMVMRTSQGPFPMETIYAWSEAAGGTRMSLRNRGVPSGFSRMAAPLMTQAIRRANRKDLLRLKVLLESHH